MSETSASASRSRVAELVPDAIGQPAAVPQPSPPGPPRPAPCPGPGRTAPRPGPALRCPSARAPASQDVAVGATSTGRPRRLGRQFHGSVVVGPVGMIASDRSPRSSGAIRRSSSAVSDRFSDDSVARRSASGCCRTPARPGRPGRGGTARWCLRIVPSAPGNRRTQPRLARAEDDRGPAARRGQYETSVLSVRVRHRRHGRHRRRLATSPAPSARQEMALSWLYRPAIRCRMPRPPARRPGRRRSP